MAGLIWLLPALKYTISCRSDDATGKYITPRHLRILEVLGSITWTPRTNRSSTTKILRKIVCVKTHQSAFRMEFTGYNRPV